MPHSFIGSCVIKLIFFYSTGYTVLKGGVTVDDEIEWIWKDAVVTYFTMICQLLLPGTEQYSAKL